MDDCYEEARQRDRTQYNTGEDKVPLTVLLIGRKPINKAEVKLLRQTGKEWADSSNVP